MAAYRKAIAAKQAHGPHLQATLRLAVSSPVSRRLRRRAVNTLVNGYDLAAPRPSWPLAPPTARGSGWRSGCLDAARTGSWSPSTRPRRCGICPTSRRSTASPMPPLVSGGPAVTCPASTPADASRNNPREATMPQPDHSAPATARYEASAGRHRATRLRLVPANHPDRQTPKPLGSPTTARPT